jgi:hypothetical protein
MGKYDDCIADCDTAVDKAREMRADYKVIGKALTRKGNALAKKGDLEAALTTYQKALTEHRYALVLVLLVACDICAHVSGGWGATVACIDLLRCKQNVFLRQVLERMSLLVDLKTTQITAIKRETN